MDPMLTIQTLPKHLGRGSRDEEGKPISRISINISHFESLDGRGLFYSLDTKYLVGFLQKELSISLGY